MIIVDAHQDIAYNAYCFDRDYRMAAYKKRQSEPITDSRIGPGRPTIGLPDALLGRVAVVFATLFVTPKASPFVDGWNEPLYRDAREAHDLAVNQIDYYDRLADEHPQVQLIRTQPDLETVLASWADDVPITERVQGVVVLMEGADPIIEPKQFEEWYQRGVRVVGPAWTKTRYSGGTGAPGPLTPLGLELLEVLADANILLDLSHLSEAAYHQALDRYEGPLVASHSNPRRFRDTDRHLSDDMIRLLAERDGVMGTVIYNRFLHPTWQPGDSRQAVPFTTVLDVIDHVCQVTGSSRHVGLGSDMDGGFGLEALPQGMDTVGDLWWVGDGLRRRGYHEADIAAILGGNFLRKLQEALPHA
jgi:membrane dipeptidase